MPRKLITEHGHRAMYQRGRCRCERCKAAQSVYARRARAREAAKAAGASVSVLPGPGERTTTGQPGPVQAAVEAELAGLSADRPVLFAVCVRLAQVLDLGTGSPSATARTLARLLEQAHAVPRSTGKLASVSALAARR